jgi:hypothetical protein
MPAIPGYLGGASTDLSNWMWGRSGDYNQGYYATIYRDMGNSLVECYLDCVCTGGTIAVDFGAEYAALDLNVTGIAAPTSATITNEDETMFQIRPYRFSEASITLEAACNVTRNHTLTWDNMVESPADMGVLNGSTYPYALPSGPAHSTSSSPTAPPSTAASWPAQNPNTLSRSPAPPWQPALSACHASSTPRTRCPLPATASCAKRASTSKPSAQLTVPLTLAPSRRHSRRRFRSSNMTDSRKDSP